ncbi:MauE/DoxX family redox-associated membrane protein [Paenibacillus sp. sptzw28]|uniref:MauE/DoxX family redox-associated membrane protein n=1 Tax=Paenibacillus sp. sptzw28 TaxID=715179 RepID=UPI0037C766AC
MVFLLGTIISFIFFSSSYSKIVSMENFHMELASYGIPFKWVPILSRIILIFEAGLFIVFLLNDTMNKWKQLLAAIFIITLTILTIVKNGLKNRECSCFGTNHPLSRFPILRNVVILLLLVIDYFLLKESYSSHEFVLSLLIVLSITFILENIKYKNELEKEMES